MKKYVLLFALVFGGLFVAGCEAPNRYRQMPSLVPRQGDAAKHSIVS
ncbi:MAG: hypothetical protein CM15mP98_11720 [Paracoccaceae bacterium]|nr:MAG: hypothetical protein CM15mP98_11720 [Paracoccaceae bacterium]